MSRHVFRLPDLGEGTVSAEIVAWHVQPGETVAEDQPLVEMSTDKAVVEVPSPVSGRLVAVAGQPGGAVAVGAELAVFETAAVSGADADSDADADAGNDGDARGGADSDPGKGGGHGEQGTTSRIDDSTAGLVTSARPGTTIGASASASAPGPSPQTRIMASPATRRRAQEAGIDLGKVAGSGPGGRILAADLEAATAGAAPADGVIEIPLIGVRRVIAQRMVEAKHQAPHFSYVEEVDVTALEALRPQLNARLRPGEPPYTYLPFIVAALVQVLAEFPQCNAHYDPVRNLILRHRAVHVGIATQTPDGLKVPVVRNADRLRLRELAAEIRGVYTAARSGRARREELTGSTITVTSLGKLGGIVSTPILNLPEVAIVGANKAVDRPVVVDGQIVIRRIMNLSSSFDHRFVDGFDAAAMIQALKARLEQPAALLID
ncbi:MAG: 2-oxo acid dehydrogenase subunit E2 [Sinobacteraceae bacterium]|nr:2-oxo acid dehydrogenase subunit E2 [Nevskiaceae bacterium]